MSTRETSKINYLLATQPSGVVLLSSWLVDNGYSPELQKRYRKSGWLTSIGTGAMIRAGDEVDYLGAIHGLQRQLQMSIHPGGKTALLMQGKSHSIALGVSYAVLFGGKDEVLPSWFKMYDWNISIKYYPSSFLPADLGLREFKHKGFNVRVSHPARAIMECLYLAPDKFDLEECYKIMEGLNTLHPDLVQSLLESCSSVKVKRLFLYMAEKAGHKWFDKMNKEKIDIGSGKRSVVAGGVYIPKYKITVPAEMEKHDRPEI
jgi:hypothetical protein